MCLSSQALLLFISLLPKEIVTHDAGLVMIAAGTGDVIWESFEDEWCTVAPFQRASGTVTE